MHIARREDISHLSSIKKVISAKKQVIVYYTKLTLSF